jgi:hypothetical protein
MINLRVLSCLLLILLATTGCRHGATDPSPSEDLAQPAVPAPWSDQDTSATMAPLQQLDRGEEEPFQRLLPPAEPGDVAFSAYGHEVSGAAYAAGYHYFLGGRLPSASLENEYRLRLEEQLLVLRWLKENYHEQAPDLQYSLRMGVLDLLTGLALERWPDGRAISDEDLRNEYDLNRAKFRQSERAQIRLILVPTRQEAEQILRRLKAGEAFGSLAASESRHESQSRFGDLEPFTRGTYQAALEEKAFAMEPGTINMVESAAGVFIVEKVANIPALDIPFAQVRQQVRESLSQKLRAEQLERIRSALGE